MNDLMAAYQAEYEPEETVTEEEKEYLKRFCDPSRKCPVSFLNVPGYNGLMTRYAICHYL